MKFLDCAVLVDIVFESMSRFSANGFFMDVAKCFCWLDGEIAEIGVVIHLPRCAQTHLSHATFKASSMHVCTLFLANVALQNETVSLTRAGSSQPNASDSAASVLSVI
jgi:hypothetical protein